MLDDHLINPFESDPKDELPHCSGSQASWTEYYYFLAYDRNSGYGFIVHVGRDPQDTEIWRSVVGISLPDGQMLVSKDFGRDGTEFGPGAGPLRIRCLKPMRTWSLEFDGLAERTNRVSITNFPHRDSAAELVKVNLVFEGAAPLWDLGKSEFGKGFSVGHGELHHWEQIYTAKGSITVGGKTIAFEGGGVRDHSHGPRDYTKLKGDVWMNAVFPSGKAVMAVSIKTGDQLFRGGYIFRNDGSPLEVVKVLSMSPDESIFEGSASIPADPLADPSHRQLKVVLETSAGQEIMTGEICNAMGSTNFAPCHETLGTDLNHKGHALQFCECGARYSWNGEEGTGQFERVLPIRNLRSTV